MCYKLIRVKDHLELRRSTFSSIKLRIELLLIILEFSNHFKDFIYYFSFINTLSVFYIYYFSFINSLSVFSTFKLKLFSNIKKRMKIFTNIAKIYCLLTIDYCLCLSSLWSIIDGLWCFAIIYKYFHQFCYLK